jgi:hypothetical protein
MNIIDLDILRPEKRIVRLHGVDIDVSFIPCGITFDIDRLTQELQKISIKKIEQNGAETRRAFELAVEICATFAGRDHPELTKEWFMANVDATQVNVFSNAIKDALIASYKGVADYGKKAEGT